VGRLAEAAHFYFSKADVIAGLPPKRVENELRTWNVPWVVVLSPNHTKERIPAVRKRSLPKMSVEVLIS